MFNLLDLLFPKRCVGCNNFGSYFCQMCIGSVTQGELICPQCQKPAVGGQTHPLCRKRLGLDGLWSLGLYRSSLREAIKQLKYKFVKELADVLINLILQYFVIYQPFILDEIKKSGGQMWIVVPVPLHPVRHNWRGFNQSALLSKDFADRIGIEYQDILLRDKHTKPQVKFKSQGRRVNLRNIFSLKTNCNISCANVLLVDDVWTTGSTLKECCFILKRAGAKQVWAITIAR